MQMSCNTSRFADKDRLPDAARPGSPQRCSFRRPPGRTKNRSFSRLARGLAAVSERLLLALLGLTLWASDGGSLLGTITDPSGTAIPGAKVTATETVTAVKQTITTDGQGFY